MYLSEAQTLYIKKTALNKHRELFEDFDSLDNGKRSKIPLEIFDDPATRLDYQKLMQDYQKHMSAFPKNSNDSRKTRFPRVNISHVKEARFTVFLPNDNLYKLFEKYKKSLALKYEQLIFIDDYEDLNESLVLKEYRSFLSRKRSDLIFIDKIYFYVEGYKNISWKLDNKRGRAFVDVLTNKEVEGLLDGLEYRTLDLVKAYRASPTYKKEHKADISFENLSPLEYEKQVAQSLEKLGWNTRVTKGSGDQGCDVLATKNNRTVAIQCKYYSKPIGNKAVQEINAGRSFYNAQYGAVITNQSFTPSAKILATKLRIELLHHTQVSQLDKLIK